MNSQCPRTQRRPVRRHHLSRPGALQEDAADLAAVIPWLPGPPLRPRLGLTDQDLERITRATEAARSPGTHRIYQYAWEQWATWCAERGFELLPADPAAMCCLHDQLVADGLAVISLSPFISVINYVHSAHGLPNPNENRAVRQVRDGLRRTYGVAPVRQAHPLSVAEIRTLVTGIDRARLGGARDTAFILVGYAGALRIGELAALALDDIESRPDGIVLGSAAPRPTATPPAPTSPSRAASTQTPTRSPRSSTGSNSAAPHRDRCSSRSAAAQQGNAGSHPTPSVDSSKHTRTSRPPQRRTDHRPLAPRWTRHRGPPRRRPDRPHRRADPAQGPLSPVRPLHPPRRRP